jgi:alkylation response protein AidB-like acyl-CoA dehydrogenase
MDFILSKEQLLIQKGAREIADEYIAPVARQIDQENRVPEEIMSMLAELGYFGLTFPEYLGGAEAGYDGYVLVQEQITRICGGLGVVLGANSLGLGAINSFGTLEQKEKYIIPTLSQENRGRHIASFAFTEPGTGSDPKQLATFAVRDNNSYVLNGTKRFISMADYPGPIVVFARERDNSEAVSAFIVDKYCPGYSVSEPWEKIGYHGASLVDVYLKDVRIPMNNRLGESGQGFDILLLGIALGKVTTSTIALGGILGAYEEALKYARGKLHRGKPISKFQSIQLKIADLHVKYETCRWLCYRLAQLANNIKDTRQFAFEAAVAKCYCGDTVVEAAKLACDIHGSYGVIKDYTIERIYRDAIIGPEIEGVSDIQRIIIAGNILDY